jgi:hypothetical protein
MTSIWWPPRKDDIYDTKKPSLVPLAGAVIYTPEIKKIRLVLTPPRGRIASLPGTVS